MLAKITWWKGINQLWKAFSVGYISLNRFPFLLGALLYRTCPFMCIDTDRIIPFFGDELTSK